MASAERRSMGVNYLRIKYLFYLLLLINEKMSELRIKVIEPEAEVYTFDPIDTEPHCKIEDIRNFVQRKFPSFQSQDIELCYGGYTCKDSWERNENSYECEAEVPQKRLARPN